MRQSMHLWQKRARHALGYAKGPIVLWLSTGRWVPKVLVLGRSPRFEVWGTMIVAGDLRLRTFNYRSALTVGPEGVLKIGRRVSINQGSSIHAQHSVTIGDRVSIGDQVRIYDTNFHPVVPGRSIKVAPVVIEDDVWIASAATVLPGTTIGRGAVIGSGCIVSGTIPPGTVMKPPSAEVAFTYEPWPEMRRR